MTKFEEWKENFWTVKMFGSEIKTWMKVCKQFLISPQRDMRKWAVEGLSYLTFNIRIKKELIKDRRAVHAIIAFAKAAENQSVLYQVDVLLVNLCSAYDKEDLIPKMEMFVNYFDVKNQILAEDNFVEERRRVLAMAGVISALVSLAKMDSPNSKELIARVFNAICSQEKLRKIVVGECGTEALLSLTLDGTDKGKVYASQALVYLALTLPSEIAFPDQMIMKVVRPILNFLKICKYHVDKNDKPKYSDNEKHDTLTVLYNLASVNNSMRKCIFETDVERIIEHCTHDDDKKLQQTSIQLLNNLVSYREVAIQFVEQRSHQLWYFMLLSVKESEDKHIKKAATDTLVTLTAASEVACKKLIDWKFCLKCLSSLLDDKDDDLKYGGTEIALNMMRSSKDIAEKLIEMDTIMKPVRALSKNDTMQNKKIKELASLVLEAAAKWDIIERNVEGNKSSNSTDNTD
ncbi:protein unc-45 homolog A-like [Temnothorax longispinosus]|uniref:protein unc-45 homolog A-like n=1 Tax=Temnothorax longispinosus TaxID=300112 RepID=UPI003A991BED